jgi:uncharacterized protein YggU (UPF0235/DUF167 family)
VAVVRTWLRVTPGASQPGVGGAYPRSGEPALQVSVRERAVDGRASRAALALVAEALDVPTRSIRLDVGARSRDKLVSIEVENAADAAVRLRALRSKST